MAAELLAGEAAAKKTGKGKKPGKGKKTKAKAAPISTSAAGSAAADPLVSTTRPAAAEERLPEGVVGAALVFGGLWYGGKIEDCPKATATFIDMPEQQKLWKFILDVEGGGSTWRLKSLLSGGWTIFKVDSPYQQFWYDELVPFVHYIPVDEERLEEDLPGKLRWAIEHDAECKQMASPDGGR